jgi:hypothetical protein
VAAAPDQVVRTVIAQGRDRGGVREPDHVVSIHHPDRLCGRPEHRSEEVLGTYLQPSEID